jgi:hypothetical protein
MKICVVDPVFTEKLLKHAKQINDFAVTHKGKYSDSVTAASEFYRYFQSEFALFSQYFLSP